MTDFLYWLADIIQWTFINVLEPLGNLPNYLFIAIIFGALLYWLYLQKKYIKKAKDEGTLI